MPTRGVIGVLTMLLVLSLSASGADGAWNKIRYRSGTVDVRVNPFDWNTTLRTFPRGIELEFAGRRKLTIAMGEVIALTYGERAYRRVTSKFAITAVHNPVALFGIASMAKEHLIGIVFIQPGGMRGAVLLAVQKDSYREILGVLSTMTGKTVEDAP